MGKTIYTERDIEDLARRGVREIEVTHDVYLTDLARERAERLEVRLRPARAATTARSASLEGAPVQAIPALTHAEKEELARLVKEGVLARLGPNADASLIDTVVRRILARL